jgi:hypothetical protein
MNTRAIPSDCFEHFTDDERFLIAEALRTHLEAKRTAFDSLPKDPLPSLTYSLSESDFGICRSRLCLTRSASKPAAGPQQSGPLLTRNMIRNRI